MLQKKKINLQALMAPLALIVLYIFFSFASKTFLSFSTLVSILDSSYYVAFLAFGITFVIITGGIDLSIGTNMMMSALIGGYMYYKGINIWVSLVAVVVIATVVGLINGLLIAYLKLPPFIATLGTMMMTQGFGSIVTKVQTMRYPSSFDDAGFYKTIFYKTANGFPSGIVLMVVFFFIALFLLNKTRFGRYDYALGANEEAMRLSGVDTKQWKCLVYTICGLFAGLAGVVYASTYTTILPGTGSGQEMSAIAAVVIGGTSMSGGSGTMTGTLIGVFVMSVLKTGLMSMGFQGHYQTFFTGLVVILAVLFDVYRNRKSQKA